MIDKHQNNYRKAKQSSIIKFFIIIILLNSVSLFKVMGGIVAQPIFVKSLNIVMIIALFIMCSLYKNALKGTMFLGISSAILLLPIFFRGFSSELSIYDYVRFSLTYYYVLLSIPLFVVLKLNKFKFESFLKCIVIITTLSFALRTGISLLEHYTGTKLFSDIYLENARDNWYRNGYLRINMPAFGLLIVPLIMYLIDTSRKRKKKYYIIILGFIMLYDLIVLQSRMQVVYTSAEILVYIVFKRRSSLRKLILYLFLIIGAVILFNSSVFNNFIDTFSTSNSIYGGSSQMRLLEISAAIEKILQNPLFGTGIQARDEIVLQFGWIGYLSDLGVLYSFVILGITPIIFDIIFIIRAIKAGLSSKELSKKNNSNYDVLGFSIAASLLMTCVTSDWMNPYYAICIPFIFAIIEYINSMNQKERKQKWVKGIVK